MYLAKILRRFSADVSPSNMSDSFRNSRRSTEFSATRYLYLLDLKRSLTAARRSISVTGTRFLLPALAKKMLSLIGTNADASSDTVREKSVTDYPRDLLSMCVCTNVSRNFPGISLLVGMSRFCKSSHAHLNLFLDGSLICMKCCIEWRFLSQSLFISWCSKNVDKALKEIMLDW